MRREDVVSGFAFIPPQVSRSIDADVAGAGADADFWTTSANLAANGFVHVFYTALHCGGHGMIDGEVAGTGRDIEVKGCLLGQT
jgi:hypothetical protein